MPSDPFAGIAGNFDGQGLSCGALQWNVGQGTLQPLVRSTGRDSMLTHMPVYGGAFWEAVLAPISSALRIVRGWQTGRELNAVARQELAAFLASPEMRAQQIAAAEQIAATAYREAQAWIAQCGPSEPSKKDFFWFFDLVTQNGGLKGLGLADANSFVAQRGDAGAEDAICDWLAAPTRAQLGARDCAKNAGIWREHIGATDLDLFTLSYLRALKSAAPSRGIVMNRKGTLALGRGGLMDGSSILRPICNDVDRLAIRPHSHFQMSRETTCTDYLRLRQQAFVWSRAPLSHKARACAISPNR